jgi:selenocysteine lyase/cysteine desulfurase
VHRPCWYQRYFGGGTVVAAAADTPFVSFRSHPSAAFEDGTPSFLSVLSLNDGLDALLRVGGMASVAQHTRALTSYAAAQLSALVHEPLSGASAAVATPRRVCELYGCHADAAAASLQGPVVTFNVLRRDGSFVSPAEVSAGDVCVCVCTCVSRLCVWLCMSLLVCLCVSVRVCACLCVFVRLCWGRGACVCV